MIPVPKDTKLTSSSAKPTSSQAACAGRVTTNQFISSLSPSQIRMAQASFKQNEEAYRYLGR
jgi:hypothetical protein